jgi:phosphoribosylaminoimidazolecarboxamide formyltransferase/IMP cyclohydrolase
MDMTPRYALISVSDKTGVTDFAAGLVRQGFAIYSTGGTARALRAAGITCTDIGEYTGFPEIMDGRVKTLHPRVFGGILARRSQDHHRQQAGEHGIVLFDVVAVNLYPFEETLASGTADEQDLVENIDIGGVALIRAAAKNFADVLVVTDPADYAVVLQELAPGDVPLFRRRALALKAFSHTARYDALISGWLADTSSDPFQAELTIGLRKVRSLRYGENPHQRAALYAGVLSDNAPTLVHARQLQGKEMSFNNYLDCDAAAGLVAEFDQPACVIVKHNNPCGAACGSTLADAYLRAYACDPVSAFGGIIACNRPVDAEAAEAMVRVFTECIVAPGYSARALEVLGTKKDLRLLEIGDRSHNGGGLDLRPVSGGMLVQERDVVLWRDEPRAVTRRVPSEQEVVSLHFAFAVVKHTKSNAIILARGRQTVGIGAGQMSRIDALHIAAHKMDQIKPEDRSGFTGVPLVLASDAFFPFRDVVDAAAKLGVTAIIQPGGSRRDDESIAAADRNGIAMLFTGTRHFRH